VLVVVLGLAFGAMTSRAWAADPSPVAIPVVLPLTGPAANIGQELQRSLRLLEQHVNDTGGIRKRPLQWDFLDDQGQPQVAVQIVNQLKSQNRPVIIGAALSALCKSMLPLVADQGPVLYCLTPAVVPAAGSYVFAVNAPSAFEEQTALRFLRERGLTRIAFITSTDASGAEADQNIALALRLPENHALSDVAHEHFNPSDLTVTGQVERVKAANPQAILIYGSPVVLGTALHSIHDSGLDVPVVVSQSLMSFNSMDQLASYLPRELYFASSFWDASATLPPGAQRKQLDDVSALFHAASIPLDLYEILPWDAASIVVEALRTVGPDANAASVRAAIGGIHGYIGADGVYDFRTGDQRGLGLKDVMMYRWLGDKHAWSPVSLGGGAPLK
jgi:branched-chain amino acid transport system substrate-binding protein